MLCPAYARVRPTDDHATTGLYHVLLSGVHPEAGPWQLRSTVTPAVAALLTLQGMLQVEVDGACLRETGQIGRRPAPADGDDRVAAFMRAIAAYKAQHWRPVTPEEKGQGWIRRVNAMTWGQDSRQHPAFWQQMRQNRGPSDH